VLCCSNDGSSCKAVCAAPEHPPDYSSPLTRIAGASATFEEADAECSRQGRRLCSRPELESGMCCGQACGFDSIRAWASDACTLPSELQPMHRLPLRAEAVRVSLNGQQYSDGFDMTGALTQPQSRQLLRGGTAFAYFDTSALQISSVLPSSGPLDGGTVVTLTGEGFDDLGARVAFLGIGGNLTNATATVPATVATGLFNGRMLTCVAPAMGIRGPARIELTLNGQELPPALTDLRTHNFTFW
jgi:hypothetical protein